MAECGNEIDHHNDDNDNDNDNASPIVVSSSVFDPERFPYSVVRGNASNLSALRGTDAQTRAAFFEERNTNSIALKAEAPSLLLDSVPISITVTLTTTTVGVGDRDAGIYGDTVEDSTGEIIDGDNENDQYNENENENENENDPEPRSGAPEEPIHGEIFVTNTQVLFVAKESDHSGSDLAIGGACVVLHAMTEEPESSVYLQLSSSSEDHNDTDCVTEVALVPASNNNNNDDDDDRGGDCQKIFDALCKLISIHPIEGEMEDDECDNGMFGFGGGGMIGGGFGEDVFGDYGESEAESGRGDGLVWAQTGRSASLSEREAMLEHLDDLLVVAPGLEDNDGRFDDAPET